jgi:SAM-dependent methyltransferase
MGLEILRRAPAGSIVHAFDISRSLIDLARSRTPRDAESLVFEVADVAKKAPDEAYERLVSRFGVMFFDDPSAAFANLARWLVPGGRFAFATWGSQSDNPWMSSVREVVTGLVEVPPVDPEAPGAFRYAEASKLLALLGQAGFRDLDVRDWDGSLAIGGGLPPAEAARFALAAFSSFGELLAKAGVVAAKKALDLLTARFSLERRGGVVEMPARVHIVSGHVAS